MTKQLSLKEEIVNFLYLEYPTITARSRSSAAEVILSLVKNHRPTKKAKK